MTTNAPAWPRTPLTGVALLLASAALAGVFWPAVRLTLGASLGGSFDAVGGVLLASSGLGLAASVAALLAWSRGGSTRVAALVMGVVAAVVSVFELFVFFVGGWSGR